MAEVALNGPTLGVLAALTGAGALLFGLIPAFHGASGPVDQSLRLSSRSSTENVRSRQGRRVLVGSQFAIATPLLIAAALLLTSLHRLERVNLGFDTRNVLTAAIRLPSAQYQDPARVEVLWKALDQRLRALPGVSSLAFANGRPPNEVDDFNNFDLELFPTAPGRSQAVTPWVGVTPEYFRTLGLTLVEGRLLDDRDIKDASGNAVVVDRAWARRFFPDGTAVGKRLKGGGCASCDWTTVVGVVSEVKYAGLDTPDGGTVYWPLDSGTLRYLVMRTATDAATVLPSLRPAIREVDSSLALSGVATIDDLVTRSLQIPRSLSLIVGMFAIVALVLSIVGIYSVMAHYVQQHSKDISIRLALGGSPRDVLQLVIGQGMKVVVGGVAIGLLTALALTRLISTLLFGIGAADGITFAAAALVMLAVAGVACFTPARRAIGVQPASVLGAE